MTERMLKVQKQTMNFVDVNDVHIYIYIYISCASQLLRHSS